jgi:hypothetical protein
MRGLERLPGRRDRHLGGERNLLVRPLWQARAHDGWIEHALFGHDVAALDAGSLDDELVARFQQGVRRAGLDLGGVGDVKRVNIVVIGRDEFGIGDRVGRREKPGPADGDAIHSLGLSMLRLG